MGFGGSNPTGHFGAADSPAAGAAGVWPGNGASATPVGAVSAPGGGPQTSAFDHAHQGVHSVNGQFGDVLVNGVTTLDSVNAAGATLVGLASASLTSGALAWVVTVGAAFRLQQSALATDGITVVAAAGKAGYQWIRIDGWVNRNWTAVLSWFVDPANSSGTASDENTGASNVLPLRTWQELARRVYGAFYTSAATYTAMSDDPNASSTSVAIQIGGTATVTVQGSALSGTPIYSGTVTSYTAMAAGPAADDNQLNDASIPVSFTASGLLADNLIAKRTNGTAAYFYIAKDLGAKTARLSNPANLAGSSILALAPGDSYSVYSLTKIPTIIFPPRGGRNAFAECGMYSSTSGNPIYKDITASRCWWNRFDTITGATTLNNCGATVVGNNLNGADGIGLFFMTLGLYRGTGAQVITGRFISLRAPTLQACGFIGNSGDFNVVASRLTVHDCSGAPAFQAIYWSTALFFTAAAPLFGLPSCVSGKGNAGAMVSALQWSQIAWSGTAAPVPCVDASTSGNAVQVGATSTNVAALPINNMGTTGNGIYASA